MFPYVHDFNSTKLQAVHPEAMVDYMAGSAKGLDELKAFDISVNDGNYAFSHWVRVGCCKSIDEIMGDFL